MTRLLFAVLAAALIAAVAEASEDPRIPIEMPLDVRGSFLEHMRRHIDSLDDVMGRLADADFKGAARVAREELVAGSGAGFGRYLPIEFREMGLGMHRAAAEFADVADAVPDEPTAADWKNTVAALQGVSTRCRACHATFRLE